MGDPDGFGIRFNNATVEDLAYSIGRGVSVYQDQQQMAKMRKQMMQIDHSWESTVAEYRQVYQNLK